MGRVRGPGMGGRAAGMRLGDPRAPRTRVTPAARVLPLPPSAGCSECTSDAGTLTLAPPAVGGARERVQSTRGRQLPHRLLIRTAAAFLGAGGSAFTLALLS